MGGSVFCVLGGGQQAGHCPNSPCKTVGVGVCLCPVLGHLLCVPRYPGQPEGTAGTLMVFLQNPEMCS